MKSLLHPHELLWANWEGRDSRAWVDGVVRDPPTQRQKCNSLLSKIVCACAQFDMNICDALLYQNIC